MTRFRDTLSITLPNMGETKQVLTQRDLAFPRCTVLAVTNGLNKEAQTTIVTHQRSSGDCVAAW